ncbi:cell division protein FtsZ [Kordiimonas marina]|uniref:cell division protein FtsZ n=1 Tax=Kordiimonas marina TaxID=2872312 RepID=UPI001FF53A50|nr:cell division protein FtsZ [Kordiimonas marina]MCJ9429468.1 cell division protein FtsZ [Kordiimonas marina]
MSIDFENTELTELTPKIAVIGVGGAGCNAVNNMIRAELQGVDFVVANTDAQALANAAADNRIQLGVEITQGLGAGAQPKIGEAAAEEASDNIDAMLNGCHMAFITAGMGGGTGTGAAPVIAKRARDKGILTVGVVTKPFQFEGGRRMKIAEAGISELAGHVDTLIIIPNQNLFRVANERTTFADAFKMADEVLHSGVRGITDLMVMPGLINLDFADVRTVMSEMGKAMMGTGEAEGETRAQDAAAAAISNPLLEEASLMGAKGVIINVTGGMDMTLYEVDEAVNMVRDQVDPDALIVFGSAFSQDLEGKLRVSVVATGIEGGMGAADTPRPVRETAPQTEPVVETADAADELAAETETAVAAEATVSESLAEVAVLMTEEEVERQAEPQAEDVAEEAAEAAPAKEDLEARAVAAQGEDAFVADAPMMPKASHPAPQPTSANPFQEAAYASGSPEKKAPTAEAPAQDAAPQRRSLFQLMTSGLRTENTEPVVPKAEPSNDAGAVVSGPELGGLSEEERPAPKPAEDNTQQLEIPSFLRRQQN